MLIFRLIEVGTRLCWLREQFTRTLVCKYKNTHLIGSGKDVHHVVAGAVKEDAERSPEVAIHK